MALCKECLAAAIFSLLLPTFALVEFARAVLVLVAMRVCVPFVEYETGHFKEAFARRSACEFDFFFRWDWMLCLEGEVPSLEAGTFVLPVRVLVCIVPRGGGEGTAAFPIPVLLEWLLLAVSVAEDKCDAGPTEADGLGETSALLSTDIFMSECSSAFSSSSEYELPQSFPS